MQGRQDQGNNPWDRPSNSADSSLSQQSFSPSSSETGQHRILRNPDEGTSRHQAIKEVITQRTSEMRAIPKRPPTMTRVDTPPVSPRAPRPQREHIPSEILHKRLLIIGSVCAILAIFAAIVGYFLASSVSNSAGPSTVTTDFLQSIADKNYTQVYQDLGPAITIRLSQDQFAKIAQSSDQCYGPIKDYAEIANSAQVQDNGQTYEYDYKITRSKLAKPYTMHITMQKDPEDNSWKVSDYGIDLGPSHPAPACQK
jgi:hypothetical protein